MANGTASLYLRLSGASDADSTGLHSQRGDLFGLAERHGLEVVATHVDDGRSGALRNRPAFLAWLRDAREGRTSHLLAPKIDRVSRGSLAGLAEFLDTLDGVNRDGVAVSPPVRFLSVDGMDSTSPSWDIEVAVRGALAKGEREMIRQRILRHRAFAVADGRVVGGRRPWPFTVAERAGGGSRWVPLPERADAIRWAAEGLVAGELSTADVVREWTRRGLPTKGEEEARTASSGAWHQSVVRRLLESPTLYGATVRHGDVVRGEDGTVRVDEDQAILSLPDWQALQAALERRATHRSPSSTAAELLAGLLHCSSCGRVMYPHHRPRGADMYRCRGAGCPRPVAVAISHADAEVTVAFLRVYGDQELHVTEPAEPVVDLAEVARVTEALRAADRVIADDVDEETTLTALRQRRELRTRIAELQDAATAPASLVPIVGTGTTYREVWEAAETPEERNSILRGAWSVVEVSPGVRGGGRGFDPGRLRYLV